MLEIVCRHTAAGATAFDEVNGDLTSKLSREGLADVDTTTPTPSKKPYVVTYFAADSAGNKAMAKRMVTIVCPDAETLCCGSKKVTDEEASDCSDPDGLSCTSGGAAAVELLCVR